MAKTLPQNAAPGKTGSSAGMIAVATASLQIEKGGAAFLRPRPELP